jgi:hypothetical protein
VESEPVFVLTKGKSVDPASVISTVNLDLALVPTKVLVSTIAMEVDPASVTSEDNLGLALVPAKVSNPSPMESNESQGITTPIIQVTYSSCADELEAVDFQEKNI